MGKKKNEIWSVVALVLAALSIWTVTQQAKDYSFKDLKEYFMNADPFWLVMAVICTACFILFEGLAILAVIKTFGHPRAVHKGVIYSAADIYFSAVTPSATGGQPACAFFMMEDGVPGAVSAVALLLNLVMYTASIMTIGVIAIIARPSIFIHFTTPSKILIIIGYLIQATLMVLIILLIKREDWVHAIGQFFIRLFTKIRIIRNPEKYEKKLDKITNEYRDCSEMIRGQYKMLVKCFLFNFLQRALQICVSVMIYLAGGGFGHLAGDIWVTHAFSVIGSNSIPIPGAIGVIDLLLLDGMADLMSEQDAITVELASRGISFYLCVFACLIIVAVGNFALKKNNTNDNLPESEDEE